MLYSLTLLNIYKISVADIRAFGAWLNVTINQVALCNCEARHQFWDMKFVTKLQKFNKQQSSGD
jgi:hypothetical protein